MARIMKTVYPVCALMLVLTMSGCLEGDSNTPGPDDLNPEEPTIPGQNLRLEDCRAFGNRQDFVQPMHPIEGPEQWEESPPFYGSHVSLAQYQCEHIEWGPFIRGPVIFVIEHYQNFRPPATCFSGDGVVGLMLSMGIDDPEIAAYANKAFNLPTYVMNASLEIDDTGGAKTMSWSWGVNEPFSTMDYRVVEVEEAERTEPRRERIFFGNGSGVSYLNIDTEPVRPLIDVPVAHGYMEPPMRLAEEGHNEWTGTSTANQVPEAVGTIVEYSDWACTPKDDNDTGNNTERPASVQGPLSSPGRW